MPGLAQAFVADPDWVREQQQQVVGYREEDLRFELEFEQRQKEHERELRQKEFQWKWQEKEREQNLNDKELEFSRRCHELTLLQRDREVDYTWRETELDREHMDHFNRMHAVEQAIVCVARLLEVAILNHNQPALDKLLREYKRLSLALV